MRIAWFTPFSARSGIGEFSHHLVPVLARHAEVEIWTADADPLYESALPVLRFGGGRPLPGDPDGYDVRVYNMGDTLRHHGEIHDFATRHPGIVILHDRVLHHMFVAKWAAEDGIVGPRYLSRMAAHYGEPGARAAADSIAGARPPVWESDEDVVNFPLDEEALQRALGAITHTREHARSLAGRWLGPVTSLQLPAYRDVLASAAAMAPAATAAGRVQLTTLGHVNANKQSHRVIEMLAADPSLAARCRYTIVGPADPDSEYVATLRTLVASVPHLPVEMLGWLDEPQLDALMAATDVFVNLRHPVMEGCSASLMRELAFGRAILCFDAGSFAELPADAVECVPPGDFAAAADALRRLVQDASHREQLGRRAREVATERSEERYALELVAFAERVARAAPALALVDRVADQLAAMRAATTLPVYDTIATELSDVLEI